MRRYPGAPYRGGQRHGSPARAGGLSLPGTAPTPATPGRTPGSFNNYKGPGGMPANNMAPLRGGLGAGRLFFRFIPWLGWGLLAWELFDWWRNEAGGKWGLAMMGYALQLDCGRVSTVGIRTTGTSSCSGTQSWGTAWNGVSRPPNLYTKQATTPVFARPDKWYARTTVQDRGVPWWPSPFSPAEPGGEPMLPPNPAFDPLPSPIGVPMPAPAPMPWPMIPTWRPNPWRSPTEQPDKGYEPKPDRPAGQPAPQPWPQPGPQPGPSPVPGPQPGPAPVPPPVVSWPPVPAPSPRPSAPPARWPVPPGPRTRERKMQTGQAIAGRILWGAINLATEGNDLLDAIWRALPKWARSKPTQLPNGAWIGAGPTQKGVDLYRHWDQLDMNQVAVNILMEELGDQLAGRVGKATAKANRNIWLQQWINNGFTLARGPAL